MSCFGDKVSLLEAFSSLGEASIAIAALGGSAFTSPSSGLSDWSQTQVIGLLAAINLLFS